MKRIVLWLVLVIFNAAGVLLIHSAINHLLTTRASANWPTVEGKILSVEVIEEENEAWQRERGEPVTIFYRPEIKYEYAVDGETFRGEKFTVEDFATNDRQRADRIVAPYAVGRTVTVYYNPAAPQEALLKPGEAGGSWGTLIMGLAFMVLPTGMVIFVGGSDLFPPLLRLWWNIKFGKYSRLQETAPTETSVVSTAAQLSESTSSSAVDSTGPSPNGEDFQETIVHWHPGSRVEIFIDPPNLWSLIFVSGIVGMLAGLFGGFLLGVTVVEGVGFRGEDERAKFFGLFSVISVLVGGYLFLSTRLTHRASRTVLDWDTNILDAHREFSFSWQGSLNDIQCLIVRCEPTKGRKRRYRATVELDVVGKQFITARTANVRRKPTAARDDALTLAEPLAAALEVPVRLEGWEELADV